MSAVSLDRMDLKKPGEDAPESNLIPAMQPLGEGARSSEASLELPSGYIDDQGVIHTEIVLREMDGRDEDLLANSKVNIQSRMNRMIQNCILSIGPYKQTDPGWSDIVLSLPVLDRLWIVLQLRILSIGPIFSAKIRCPDEECAAHKKPALQNVDLNEFTVKPLADPTKRTYSGVLPKSQQKFVCRIFNGADEGKLSKQAQKNKDDLMTLVIASRLVSLDDKPVSLQEIKKLKSLDRQHIRNKIKENEGEIDRTMECTCPECGLEFSEEVDIGDPNFFFPSET